MNCGTAASQCNHIWTCITEKRPLLGPREGNKPQFMGNVISDVMCYMLIGRDQLWLSNGTPRDQCTSCDWLSETSRDQCTSFDWLSETSREVVSFNRYCNVYPQFIVRLCIASRGQHVRMEFHVFKQFESSLCLRMYPCELGYYICVWTVKLNQISELHTHLSTWSKYNPSNITF